VPRASPPGRRDAGRLEATSDTRPEMRAAAWLAPGQIETVGRPRPRAEPGQAVIAVAACGICGSDLHSFDSGFAARPGQVLGHELSGVVVEAPQVEGLEPGARVVVRPLIPCGECDTCGRGEPQLCTQGLAQSIGYGSDGGFAEYVLVPRAEVGLTVFPLPDSVDDRAAALVEPLAVALHAVGRAPRVQGAEALVLGAGTIGLGVAAFLRLGGVASVTVVDPSPLRLEAAMKIGADAVIDPGADESDRAAGPSARDPDAPAAPTDGPESADLVFECAGAAGTISTAIRAVRPGGAIIVSALFGRRVQFSPDRLTAKEALLIGAFGYRDEFPAVIDALASSAIDAEHLISHELPLERIADAFRLQADPAASLKVLVRP
jgi:(R,R)-butanediol dehydrogenase / meso-butanediol dehydrogenase / diacetyl reductase